MMCKNKTSRKNTQDYNNQLKPHKANDYVVKRLDWVRDVC